MNYPWRIHGTRMYICLLIYHKNQANVGKLNIPYIWILWVIILHDWFIFSGSWNNHGLSNNPIYYNCLVAFIHPIRYHLKSTKVNMVTGPPSILQGCLGPWTWWPRAGLTVLVEGDEVGKLCQWGHHQQGMMELPWDEFECLIFL